MVFFLYHQDTTLSWFSSTYLMGHTFSTFSAGSPFTLTSKCLEYTKAQAWSSLFSSYAHSLGNPFHLLALKITCVLNTPKFISSTLDLSPEFQTHTQLPTQHIHLYIYLVSPDLT